MIATSISILASGIINLMLKSAFFDAPGGFAEFYFYENIKAFFIPLTYQQLEITYGIVGPAEAFLGSLAVIAVVVLRGWSYCPQKVHQHLITAIAINLPLFLLFCAVGELRNLSLLFVGFVILMGFSIDRRIDGNGYAKRLTYGNVTNGG